MFREYVELVEASVAEGVQRGVDLFLENINQEMVIDQITEGFEGIDNVVKQLFHESGYSVTELEDGEVLNEEEDTTENTQTFDQKLDAVLDELKGSDDI
jgi:hypothetical protein